MRLHIFFRRIGPTLLLLKWAAATPAMAGSASGTLQVTMTVLPSCAVSAEPPSAADSRSSDTFSVQCPPTYPFRASIARDASPGVMDSPNGRGVTAAGQRRMSLSQLDAEPGRAASAGPVMLTIAY
jgi:hypothetical protein